MATCAHPNCDEPVYRRGLCLVDDLRTPEVPADAPLRVAQLQRDEASFQWPAVDTTKIADALEETE